ncbi:MAG: hypothetical protein H0Z35_11825 [Thermoanaerobacteraceae bacterium]|nr:hypothetical protein [Thermoanaerobacteraceae bacterium]
MLRKPSAMFLLTVILLIVFLAVLHLPQMPEILHSIRISYAGLDAEKIISNSEQLKIFTDMLNDKREKSPLLWYGRREVTFFLGNGGETYTFDGKFLYDNDKTRRIKTGPRTRNLLQKNFHALAQDTFAPMTSWSEAKNIFPRKARAKVTDLETGLSFWVQRRGGTYHADVQPLSKEDTAVMKKIFHGRWTWKRRAIIVEVGHKKMAASMNGMPHGQGAIKNNNFPGHFCIHFYNSLTHGSRSRDPAHHLMIMKAAGVLEDYLAQATPLEVARAFLLGIEQQDQYLLKITSKITSQNQLELLEKINNWADINFHLPDSRDDAHYQLLYVIPAELALLPNDSTRRIYTDKVLVLTRESLTSPWLVDLNLSPY